MVWGQWGPIKPGQGRKGGPIPLPALPSLSHPDSTDFQESFVTSGVFSVTELIQVSRSECHTVPPPSCPGAAASPQLPHGRLGLPSLPAGGHCQPPLTLLSPRSAGGDGHGAKLLPRGAAGPSGLRPESLQHRHEEDTAQHLLQRVGATRTTPGQCQGDARVMPGSARAWPWDRWAQAGSRHELAPTPPLPRRSKRHKSGSMEDDIDTSPGGEYYTSSNSPTSSSRNWTEDMEGGRCHPRGASLEVLSRCHRAPPPTSSLGPSRRHCQTPPLQPQLRLSWWCSRVPCQSLGLLGGCGVTAEPHRSSRALSRCHGSAVAPCAPRRGAVCRDCPAPQPRGGSSQPHGSRWRCGQLACLLAGFFSSSCLDSSN